MIIIQKRIWLYCEQPGLVCVHVDEFSATIPCKCLGRYVVLYMIVYIGRRVSLKQLFSKANTALTVWFITQKQRTQNNLFLWDFQTSINNAKRLKVLHNRSWYRKWTVKIAVPRSILTDENVSKSSSSLEEKAYGIKRCNDEWILRHLTNGYEC